MKMLAQKLSLSVVAIVFAVILVAGCQKELSGSKKGRLVAAENTKLKKQLDERGIEIRKLNQLHEKEIQEQEKRLVECLNQQKILQQEIGENISEQVDSILKVVLEQNAEFRKETAKLKAQLEQLTK